MTWGPSPRASQSTKCPANRGSKRESNAKRPQTSKGLVREASGAVAAERLSEVAVAVVLALAAAAKAPAEEAERQEAHHRRRKSVLSFLPVPAKCSF